jgi:hypothetical protein
MLQFSLGPHDANEGSPLLSSHRNSGNTEYGSTKISTNILALLAMVGPAPCGWEPFLCFLTGGWLPFPSRARLSPRWALQSSPCFCLPREMTLIATACRISGSRRGLHELPCTLERALLAVCAASMPADYTILAPKIFSRCYCCCGAHLELTISINSPYLRSPCTTMHELNCLKNSTDIMVTPSWSHWRACGYSLQLVQSAFV